MPEVTFTTKRLTRKSRATGRAKHRPSAIRLSLTTKDIAQLFQVKEDTIRHWMSKNGTLLLTGNPVEDFKLLYNLYREHLKQE